MIRLEHLRKEYPGVTPLRDVSVTINDGDVISVIGPSGTGKSTLLRCINRLEEPTSGDVFFGDIRVTDPDCDINEVRKKMGMVFQSFNLFGHMTVLENVMVPQMDLLGRNKQEAYDNAIKYLRAVGLKEKAFSFPDELSGGQKQRIAIARTLAMGPDVILFDEPTSALDPTMVGEVERVIAELARTGRTMLIVTHEMNFARSVSNRIFYMDDGGIYEEGTPEEIFDHPKGELTRRFIRQLKVLQLDIEGRDTDLPGEYGKIDGYCTKNQIGFKTSRRIRLLFEEVVQRNIIPDNGDPKVHVLIEYSENEGSVTMTFEYGGRRFDILTEGDELSVSVIKGVTSDASYQWNESSGYGNVLKLVTGS